MNNKFRGQRTEELKDLKANSVRIVNMDKVKIADLSKDNLQGE